jgi:multiple sugar transport system ATP-binding protein
VVRDPKIFLFDEPLSNLDAELRVATRKELAALHAEIGGTMIYVTHDQVEAMTLADRIVVLRAGCIEQIGSPLELYNRPRNVFVAGFIGSPRMNLLPATVAARNGSLRLKLGSGEVALQTAAGLAPGAHATLGIRPEHVTVGQGDGALTVTVDLVEQLGAETFVYASAPDLPQITLRQDGQTRLARGDTVAIRVDPQQIHLFDEAGTNIAVR